MRITTRNQPEQHHCTCNQPPDHKICDDPYWHYTCGCRIEKLWWTTVRPRLARLNSWPTQNSTTGTCPNCGCLLQHHYDDGCARCICPTSNTEAVYRRTLERP